MRVPLSVVSNAIFDSLWVAPLDEATIFSKENQILTISLYVPSLAAGRIPRPLIPPVAYRLHKGPGNSSKTRDKQVS